MSAPMWFLWVRFFADDPIPAFDQAHGPFTEQECMRCGDAMHGLSTRLAPRMQRRRGTWICLQSQPGEKLPARPSRRICGEGG